MVQLCGGRLEVGQAGEVVGGGGQFEPELVAGPAEVAQLDARADRLDPAEHLFDDLAPALTLGVARMPSRTSVNRAAPALFVLGDPRSSRGQAMGCHPQAAQVPDEVARVVGPVGAQRGRSLDAAFEHRQGGVPFGVAACPWLDQGSASVSTWPR